MREGRGDPLIAHCREAIRRGSRSFARASALFDAETRDRAHLLYAWCRYCDDEIDGQRLGHAAPAGEAPAGDMRDRLARLHALTAAALHGTAPLAEPAFLALRRVVTRCGVPERHPFELLEGFRWDAEGRRYRTLDDLLEYCYHVAGCVGVMMAYAMGVRDEDALRRAADLGIAFQLTNIARDVADDARAGRVYLPLAWLEQQGIDPADLAAPGAAARAVPVVSRLLDEAERYYRSAAEGLRHLPFRSAWAVAAAARIYREIGSVVRARGGRAWDGRAVVSGPRKALALGGALVVAATAVTVGRTRATPPREGLWTMIGGGSGEAPRY